MFDRPRVVQKVKLFPRAIDHEFDDTHESAPWAMAAGQGRKGLDRVR